MNRNPKGIEMPKIAPTLIVAVWSEMKYKKFPLQDVQTSFGQQFSKKSTKITKDEKFAKVCLHSS